MSNHFSLAMSRIRRSPYQAASAIAVMTLTLFLACIFMMLAAGSSAILKYFETRPQINAFFKQEYIPTPQEIERISAQLTSTGLVETVRYISKEDALTIYRDLNKSDPLLLEAVTANILPASLEISAFSLDDLSTVAEQLKKETNIDDVRFAQDIVESLGLWTKSIRIVGISLVGAHVFITFIVILLVIGIKVAARREEIFILQLLGASPSYIAAPFIYEGMIYGLTGGFIAWGAAYLLLLYTMGFWVSFLSGIPILPPPLWFMFSLLGVELLLGVLVGSIGAIFATRRFLKS